MVARLFPDVKDDEQAQRSTDYERHQISQYQAQASERTAALVSNLRRKYPWMTKGAALSLAKGGYGPQSDVAKEVARQTGHLKIKKGVGWHSIGDFVGSAARVGGALLQSGVEGVDAEFRNMARAVREKGVVKGIWYGGHGSDEGAQRHTGFPTTIGPANQPTTLDIALRRWRDGQDAGLGEGILPDINAPSMQEQAQHARAVYSINGHAGTPGRLLASTITEPGTKPYNVLSGLTDAAADIFADPVAGGLSAVGKARRASKLFSPETTGLIRTHRFDTMPEVVNAWLHGSAGSRLIKYATEETDPYRIWRRLGREKIGNETARQLARATDETEVADVLMGVLGTKVREKPVVGLGGITRPFSVLEPAGLAVRERLDRVRLLHMMPGTKIDPRDLDDAAVQMERFLRNARVPEETFRKSMNQVLESEGSGDLYNAVSDAMDGVRDHLVDVTGGNRTNIGKLTKMWKNHSEYLTKYYVDDVGNNVPVLGATVAGTEHVLPHPHTITELLNNPIPLPDARDIRRVTSHYGRILKGPVDVATPVFDFISSDIWKPLVLLRPAWTLRVVGEEQIRMGAAGHDSLIRHPLSAIAWATGRKGTIDVNGDLMADVLEFAKSQSQRGGGWQGRVRRMGYEIVHRSEGRAEDFAQGWRGELGQLAEDPLGKRLAGGWSTGDKVPGGLSGNHLQDAKRWFWAGPGKKMRDELSKVRGMEGLGFNQNIADDYVESVFERVHIKTGGDQRLLDAVAAGKLDDIPFDDDRVASKLGALFDEGVGPNAVKGELTMSAGGHRDIAFERLDKATEWAFNTLMSRPTNFLSRSPTFRQFYWQRIEEMMPHLTAEAQEAAIKAAQKAGLERGTLRNLARRTLGKEAKSSLEGAGKRMAGELTLDDADVIAKGFGLDETRKLLYDLSDRSQIFDVLRIAMPFGEAWKEVLTRWAMIAAERPQVIRRAEQVVQGARQGGFFYTNPDTGEEMFAFSGKDFVGSKLLGVDPLGAATSAATGGMPAPFEGRVAGLNLFSNNPLIPGLGPVVQIPIGHLLPDKPEWDGIHKLVSPQGGEDDTLGGSFLPAWVKKIKQTGWIPKWLPGGGVDDDRLFANTVKEVAQYLVSTGDYDTDSEDDLNRLEDDARHRAKMLYLVRGLAQAFAPSAPSPKFMVEDKDGDLMARFRVIERFKELQDDDFDTAVPRFLDEFGKNAFALMQPFSEGGGVTTEEGLNWLRDHKGLAEKYPDAYSTFAPQGGRFSFAAYERTFASGERRSLSPREFLHNANDRVATAIYHNARDMLGAHPSDAQRVWLRDVRDALGKKYPGFDPGIKDPQRRDRVIRQLTAAVNEPELGDSKVAAAIRTYLLARDTALSRLETAGYSSFKAKAARPVREWLRQVGAAITAQVGDFADVWDRVFDRELPEEEEV